MPWVILRKKASPASKTLLLDYTAMAVHIIPWRMRPDEKSH